LEEEILAVERVDRVSGLYARTYFDELYRREIKLAERQRRALAFLLISLSGETLDGPDADQAIRVVGEAMRGSLRKKVDIAGRYDHDAFAMVLLDTEADGVASFVARMEKRLTSHHAEGRLRGVSVSYGFGTVSKDGYAGLIKAARHSGKRLL
jgi:diguanylate cyclase (GGDEF)-like protein